MNVFPLNIKTYIQTGCLSCKSEINDINNRINAITTTNIYCHECGANNEYIINNNVIHGKLVERTEEKGIALLKYVDDPSLLILVETYFHYENGKLTAESYDSSFYFEESTCPTNYLKCAVISHNGDTDPHGVFQFVRQLTYNGMCAKFNITKDDLLDPNNNYLEQLFPEIIQQHDKKIVVNMHELNHHDSLFLPVTDRSVMVKTNVGNYIECYSVTEIPTYEEGGNPYILILNKLTDEVIEYIDIQSWGYINET